MGWRAGAVAVVACVLVSACSSTPGGRDEEAPAGTSASTHSSHVPRPAIEPESVPPCPAWDEEPDYPNGPLPPGAVSLRVCAGDDPVSRPPRWIQGVAPPDDPLVTGVAALIDDVNARSGWPDDPDLFCSQEGRPRIKYVFGYPDGSTTTITHGYGECHVLELAEPEGFPTTDSLVKLDAVGFRDAVAAALLEQRRAQQPPRTVADAPGCLPNIAPQSILPVSELDLASAALCLLPDGRRYRRVELDPSYVDRLDAVLQGEGSAGGGCSEIPVAKVVGTSTWNDPLVLNISGCSIERWGTSYAGEPDHLPLGESFVADLLALPRGPWQRQP